jgi:hypothetical protein
MEDQERMIREHLENDKVPVAKVSMKMSSELDDEFHDQTYLPVAIAHSEPYTINGRDTMDYLLVYLNLRQVSTLRPV